MIRIISERVVQKNSRETDAMDCVKHEVTAVLNGKEVITHLMATDPMQAIQLAHSLPENAWS
jgi:CMP-N-acetylneuraminic acid synthetase